MNFQSTEQTCAELIYTCMHADARKTQGLIFSSLLVHNRIRQQIFLYMLKWKFHWLFCYACN